MMNNPMMQNMMNDPNNNPMSGMMNNPDFL